MYKFYIVPDATTAATHAELYTKKELLWDPHSESDAYAIVDPTGKKELNKASTVEFTVLPANVHYNDFHKRKTVIIIYDDDQWLFEGIVTSVTSDFYKQKKITCSDVLVYLNDSIQLPDEKNDYTYAVYYEPTESNGYTHVKYYDEDPDSNAVSNDGSATISDSGASSGLVSNNSGSGISTTKKIVYTNRASKKETIGAHITRLLTIHSQQVDPFKCISPGRLADYDKDEHEFDSSSYRTTWSALYNDVVEEYGRYITITCSETDHELYLNYLDIQQMTSNKGIPVIQFAENMIEMSENDDDDEDIFTVLLPVGKNDLMLNGLEGHGHDAIAGSGIVDPYIAKYGEGDKDERYVVVSDEAIKTYGKIVKTQSFSDVTSKETLYTKAVEYIRNNYDFKTEYSVKAIDLYLLNKSLSPRMIDVGDKCHLISKWHQVDVQDLFVIDMDFDFMNPENNSYTIGVPSADKEANNRSISGQTSSTSSSASSASDSYSAGSSATASKLDSVIEVTDWGLTLHSRLLNEYTDSTGLFKTKFEQTEKYIELMAQKVFGVEDDAGEYKRVTAEMLKDSNPKEMGWYQYDTKKGQYYLTDHTSPQNDEDGNPIKYYYMTLATRVSNIKVDEGGIHARVNGNYLTSTASASWIEANEDAILALTGHLYVDSEGHVHVSAGSGMETDHKAENTELTYIRVPSSMYTEKDDNGNTVTKNPSAEKWYERKLNESGGWDGDGKSDQATAAKYYKLTDDPTIDYSKPYYYKSYVRETFQSDYGIYDEDNLTAGIVARVINYPNYKRVRLSDVNNARINNESPHSKGWYEYNKETGLYAMSTNTELPSISVYNSGVGYYTVDNNMTSYTAIRGNHIVIGGELDEDGNPILFQSMDDDMKEKMKDYINNKNLEGTITEIASDVVYVNALFAKYIEAEVITADTSLWSEYVHCDTIEANKRVNAGKEMVAPDFWFRGNPDEDPSESNSIKHGLLSPSVSYDTDGKVTSDETITASTSGDTVTLSFYTMDSMQHSVSFDKPASLAKAVWSSGSGGNDNNKDLKIYTIGGYNGGKTPQWTFYKALVTYPTYYQGKTSNGDAYIQDSTGGGVDGNDAPLVAYKRSGSDLGVPSYSILASRPTLKVHVELSGDDWDKNGNAVAFPHDPEESSPVIDAWSKYIYVDAKDAYDDGENVGIYATSLKTIAWSSDISGNNATNKRFLLNLTTNAGKEYFFADLTLPAFYSGKDKNSNDVVEYIPDGKDISSVVFNGKPVLKTTATMTGTWTGSPSDDDQDDPVPGGETNGWFKDIYIDATKAYDGGFVNAGKEVQTYCKTNSDTIYTDADEQPTIILGYADNCTVKGRYKANSSTSNYTYKAGIIVKSPSGGLSRTYSEYNSVTYIGKSIGQTDTTTIVLEYGKSATIYAQRALDGENFYSNTDKGITVTAPSAGSVQTYAKYSSTVYEGGTTVKEIILGYGKSVTVYGRQRLDGETSYSNADKGIKVTAPSNNSTTYSSLVWFRDSSNTVHTDENENSSFEIPAGESIIVYSERWPVSDTTNVSWSNGITISAASGSGVSSSSITIPDNKIVEYDSEDDLPSGVTTFYNNNMISKIKDAVKKGKLVSFTIYINGVAKKTFALDFT